MDPPCGSDTLHLGSILAISEWPRGPRGSVQEWSLEEVLPCDLNGYIPRWLRGLHLIEVS